MNRREFLRTAGGAAGATAAAGGAAAPAAGAGAPALQDEDGEEAEDGADEDAEADGPTQTVIVGPAGDLVFEPETAEVEPGTTVVWEWDSDGHNVNPTAVPEGAEWEGHPDVVDAPNTYEHTFDTEGTYEYECTPHVQAEMLGEVVVEEGITEGGGGREEADPATMGVPIQKHFVGAGAFLGIFATLVFTFYVLKYGESAHTSAPGKRD